MFELLVFKVIVFRCTDGGEIVLHLLGLFQGITPECSVF